MSDRELETTRAVISGERFCVVCGAPSDGWADLWAGAGSHWAAGDRRPTCHECRCHVQYCRGGGHPTVAEVELDGHRICAPCAARELEQRERARERIEEEHERALGMDELWELDHCGPFTLYRMFDADYRLLYVGLTTVPKGRFKAHAREKHWWPNVVRIEIEHYETGTELREAETTAIADEEPLHNIAGRRPRELAVA